MSFLVRESFEMESGDDFVVRVHGLTCLLQPLTRDGRKWVDDHMSSDLTQWESKAVPIEWFCLEDLLIVIAGDGLSVRAHKDSIH
jgi:hypothetical protein